MPGAHQGRGLGNKFLDDLRHADALIHVVDVSGTTDAEGKATRGYDPSVDIEWLHSEIVRWVLGNLMEKWLVLEHSRSRRNGVNTDSSIRGSIKRRHVATKANPVDTLQGQFSGYGSTSTIVARCLDRLGLKEPLEAWSDETVEIVVKAFIDEKFPTVYALNKIDHPDADKVRGPLKIRRLYTNPGRIEYQQNRQNARSSVHRPLLRNFRSLPSATSQARVHQVCGG